MDPKPAGAADPSREASKWKVANELNPLTLRWFRIVHSATAEFLKVIIADNQFVSDDCAGSVLVRNSKPKGVRGVQTAMGRVKSRVREYTVFCGLHDLGPVRLRIPTEPATYSDLKAATYSDPMPAGVPI